MRVLVTGGSGFLGQYVARTLANAGYDTVIFDIRRPPNNDYPYLIGDLTNSEDVLRATANVEAVCHLGGVGDVYLAFEKPWLAASANVAGTARLLEACLQNGVGKLVYASTWEVYGEPQYLPVDEKHPCQPDHPYNITKLSGEQLTLAFDRLKGLPTIALRLGTAYGEGMRPNSVFSIFIRRAMQGEPLTINGSGAQSRQFVHAGDVGRAFRLAIETPVHGEAFNIVGSENISIKQLADLVIERLPTRLIYESARLGDIAPARLSNEKAQHMLGWLPAVTFREGLFALVDSYLEHASVGLEEKMIEA